MPLRDGSMLFWAAAAVMLLLAWWAGEGHAVKLIGTSISAALDGNGGGGAAAERVRVPTGSVDSAELAIANQA